MAGTGCCVELGDDLKKTRSCDSTPERTVDCGDEKESRYCHDTAPQVEPNVPQLPQPDKWGVCAS
jgi:hypothetical protein